MLVLGGADAASTAVLELVRLVVREGAGRDAVASVAGAVESLAGAGDAGVLVGGDSSWCWQARLVLVVEVLDDLRGERELVEVGGEDVSADDAAAPVLQRVAQQRQLVHVHLALRRAVLHDGDGRVARREAREHLQREETRVRHRVTQHRGVTLVSLGLCSHHGVLLTYPGVTHPGYARKKWHRHRCQCYQTHTASVIIWSATQTQPVCIRRYRYMVLAQNCRETLSATPNV